MSGDVQCLRCRAVWAFTSIAALVPADEWGSRPCPCCGGGYARYVRWTWGA